jgi:AraC-like DNA-binding protein
MASENDPQRAESDAQLFADWATDMGHPQSGLMEAVLLEMEARLLRMALAQPHDHPKESQRNEAPTGEFTKAEQMAQLIARRYTKPLTIELIAEAVDLHPNYAMSLFRKAFGMTLIEYLTQHRVSHAERLLVTTDEKILQVAIESGFGSLSRFSEAFQRASHCSPREYRRRYRGA